MAKDEDGDDKEPKSGRRMDGKPYKDDNTRPDGSYEVGKNRPPKHSRFAVNDGRTRGRRAKGTKNVLSQWRDELNRKITINEGGKSLRITNLQGLIKTRIREGLKGKDRPAELSLRYAELSEKREPGLQSDDFKIIERWLGSILDQDDSDDRDRVQADHGEAEDQVGDDEA